MWLNENLTMEYASRTVRQSKRAIQAQLKKLTWLGETQAALGWGLVVVLAALVGTLYVTQASRIAATGRSVQLMQHSLEQLRRENGEIERDIAEAQSLAIVDDRARSLGFVRALPSDIEYLIVDQYPTSSIASSHMLIQPEPLVPPAATFWEALFWQFSDGIANLMQGEASES